MILDAVLKTLRQQNAFAAGELVIVAVSGGCDSVALLHLLQRMKQCLGIDLHVASLDHRLRAEAGRRDLDFVASLAAGWQLPVTVAEVDVPRLAREWGLGIEAAARRARYAFLAQVAREQGSASVAVGHHALDQAETVLMHIIRGSGSRGLRGMRLLSQLPNQPEIRLLRPLLQVSKAELEAYCHEHTLPYRVDETNADIGYRRNYLRHEVLRRLTRLNADAVGAIERLAESATIDEDFMAAHFAAAVLPLADVSPARWLIAKADFEDLHEAMKRRFLQAAYRMVSLDSAALSHRLILDLINWSAAARAGDRRDMGGAAQMRLGYDKLSIERKDAIEAHETYRLIPAGTKQKLALGEPFLRHGLAVSLSTGGGGAGGNSINLRANLALCLRTRRPGDRFKPKGMGGHSRKIKHWMIDRKVPRQIRDRIPLISAEGEIIAICLGDVWHLADTAQFDNCDSAAVTLSLS